MFGRKIIAKLAEIDENLIRSPLTPAQAASAIFRRKAIYQDCTRRVPWRRPSRRHRNLSRRRTHYYFEGRIAAVFRIDLSTMRKWQRADCSTKGSQG